MISYVVIVGVISFSNQVLYFEIPPFHFSNFRISEIILRCLIHVYLCFVLPLSFRVDFFKMLGQSQIHHLFGTVAPETSILCCALALPLILGPQSPRSNPLNFPLSSFLLNSLFSWVLYLCLSFLVKEPDIILILCCFNEFTCLKAFYSALNRL